jgi:hypothetical protein
LKQWLEDAHGAADDVIAFWEQEFIVDWGALAEWTRYKCSRRGEMELYCAFSTWLDLRYDVYLSISIKSSHWNSRNDMGIDLAERKNKPSYQTKRSTAVLLIYI